MKSEISHPLARSAVIPLRGMPWRTPAGRGVF